MLMFGYFSWNLIYKHVKLLSCFFKKNGWAGWKIYTMLF